jgi:hypothetical protein
LGLVELQFVSQPYEIAIMGDDFEKARKEFDKNYLPYLLGRKNRRALIITTRKIEVKRNYYFCFVGIKFASVHQ